MRILHIATLVTPDGAYGGPIRVALNQLSELARLGHTVELIAGARGFDGNLPTSIQGVPVKLFPVRSLVPGTGFAGLAAAGLQTYLRAELRIADVVHVHLARDLITLPAAAAVARSEVPLVLQTHGMIDESERRLAAIIDAVYTRRILRRSERILSLTAKESASLLAVARTPLPVSAIGNGIAVLPRTTSNSPNLEVLFLARLHPRKRASYFVEMARTLLDEGTDATFAMVGPDEGEGTLVRELIAKYGFGERLSWEGPLSPEDTLDRMKAAAIYVLPSVEEVFPMSVLEAMSLGLPVVITESNGLAEPLKRAGAGIVVDESLAGLVAGTRELLHSAQLRARIGETAKALIRDEYSIAAVAAQLETIYAEAAVPAHPRVKDTL